MLTFNPIRFGATAANPPGRSRSQHTKLFLTSYETAQLGAAFRESPNVRLMDFSTIEITSHLTTSPGYEPFTLTVASKDQGSGWVIVNFNPTQKDAIWRVINSANLEPEITDEYKRALDKATADYVPNHRKLPTW